MSKTHSNSGPDFVHIIVERKDVEKMEIGPTLTALRRLLSDRLTVENFRERMNIAFAGYDEDRRELHEIEEVRRFVSELDKEFPFWFYFLSLRTEILTIFALTLCRYSKKADGMLVLDPADYEKFLVEHFGALNRLFEAYHFDQKENETITNQILNYFEEGKKSSLVH